MGNICENSIIDKSAIYERRSGLKLDTIDKAPSCFERLAIGFYRKEEIVTDDAIKQLSTKWVITKCSHEYGELLSSYLCDKSMIALSTLFLT